MKKTALILTAIILSFTSCDKAEEGNLLEPLATGTLNGILLDFNVIMSDVIQSNGTETAYIVMRKDFEGYNKPSANGKQLLIRIEPYNGAGTYNVNANSFWILAEEITIAGSVYNATNHRFSSDEKDGMMKVVITEDAVKQGKRILVGNFEGKNGITEKITSTGSQTQPLKTMEFKNVSFVAPEGEF